ncbi:hypothetical protein [Parasitella parasitica]|uniref:Uncharacterized protein n=1 Tax=Parasitella parasitica TaxID=35722 RepID=A0A0B7NWF1_9FUNG|nr:hypothetical protein [Parasitella parasitica]
MRGLPFLDAKIVPTNCIPICPSFQQVLRIEESLHISGLDKIESGVLRISSFDMSPAKECWSGKMYFVVEFLRQFENRKLGYCIVSIVTNRSDVEEALVKVLRHYISSQIVRIESLSVEGYTDGIFVGGVTVHIKSDPDQQINQTAQTDLLLLYDADLTGVNLTRIFKRVAFDCNPAILYLSTFNSPESRYRDFHNFTKENHINPHALDFDDFPRADPTDMFPIIMRENGVFTAQEFRLWNDSVAQQVLDWFTSGHDINYQFENLMFPHDVPSKYFQPPQ